MDFILGCTTVKSVTDLTYNLMKVSEAFSTVFTAIYYKAGVVRCCKWELP